MSRPSLVLVEHVSTPGAAAADARVRAALLQDAGFDVEVFVCDPARDGQPLETERGPVRVALLGADRAALLVLRERVAAAAPRTVVVASADPDGGAPLRALAGDWAQRWWPTGLTAVARADGPALVPGADPLGWGVGDPARGARARLPLWDGDYVLAPVPLSGRAGEELLEGFARAAGDDALDLVVLDDPAPEFEAVARRLGIATRVHFAGAAPREAEFAWWSAAAAAVFGGERPFAAGLVWRALGCGCPLLVAGQAALPSALRGWLAAQGCLAGPPPRECALGQALVDLLDRGRDAEAAAARGRALALEQHARLPGRLAAALGRIADARAA